MQRSKPLLPIPPPQTPTMVNPPNARVSLPDANNLMLLLTVESGLSNDENLEPPRVQVDNRGAGDCGSLCLFVPVCTCMHARFQSSGEAWRRFHLGLLGLDTYSNDGRRWQTTSNQRKRRGQKAAQSGAIASQEGKVGRITRPVPGTSTSQLPGAPPNYSTSIQPRPTCYC